MTRVVHLHWTALPAMGGVEVHCASLMHQLITLGTDVELFSGTPDAEVGYYLGALRLGVEATDDELEELVSRCDSFDVLHWHNPQWHKPDVTVEVVRRLRRRGWPGRLIFDLHNIDDVETHWSLLRDLPAECVAHSSFVAGTVSNRVAGVEVEILPLALTADREPYSLPRTGQLTVLQPTRFTAWKGSDLSLRSMIEILEAGDIDASFVHAGTSNMVWPSAVSTALLERASIWRKRGLISLVHYSPSQSWHAIAAADLVLHPTTDRGPHGEPFSLSVAQAIICGTPVIASDSGHLPALLSGYSASRLVPAGNQKALTAAIRAELLRAGERPPLTDGDRALARRLLSSFETAGRRHMSFYSARPRRPQPATGLSS